MDHLSVGYKEISNEALLGDIGIGQLGYVP